MTHWRIRMSSNLVFSLVSALLLPACGDSAATSAPTATFAAATTSPTVAVTAATATAVTTTVAPTTVASTTATLNTGASTTTPATEAAKSSPLELVKKLDISAVVKVPTGLAFDQEGNLYVVDAKLNTINKFDPNGKLILQWGKYGSGPADFNLDRHQNPFMYGGYLAIDSAGNIYLPDAFNHRIQKFDTSGKLLTMWGSAGGDDGQFDIPASIVIDKNNNLYVTDGSINPPVNRIEKFDSNGKFLGSYKNLGNGDGQYQHGSLSAIDRQGNLYLTDDFTNRLQIFDSNWKFLRKFGTGGTGDGQFNGLGSVVFDTKGNLYINDGSPDSGSRIQVFTPTGKYLGCWDASLIGGDPWLPIVSLITDNKGNFYYHNYSFGSVIYVLRTKL